MRKGFQFENGFARLDATAKVILQSITANGGGQYQIQAFLSIFRGQLCSPSFQ